MIVVSTIICRARLTVSTIGGGNFIEASNLKPLPLNPKPRLGIGGGDFIEASSSSAATAATLVNRQILRAKDASMACIVTGTGVHEDDCNGVTLVYLSFS
jgi:hypothetical protein